MATRSTCFCVHRRSSSYLRCCYSEDAAGCMIPVVLRVESRERKSLVSGLWLTDEGAPGNTVFEDPGSPFLALIGVPLRLEGYLIRIFGTGDDFISSRRFSLDWKERRKVRIAI
jgi:hypothetical protein